VKNITDQLSYFLLPVFVSEQLAVSKLKTEKEKLKDTTQK